MTPQLKWTCDAQGNWRQVLVVLVRLVDGRLVETNEQRSAA